MWADTFLTAERAHLLRLATWAMVSTLAGTAVLAVLQWRRRASPLLFHFALQSLAWGLLVLSLVWVARGTLALRDLGGARSVERLAWFTAGWDVGLVAVGVTVVVAGWAAGRRLGVIGAGIGIVVQGLALLAMAALFVSRLATLV